MNRKEAQAAGSKTYTGSPCKKCGETERYCASTQCVSCVTKSKSPMTRARRARTRAKERGRLVYLGQKCKNCDSRVRSTRTKCCIRCQRNRATNRSFHDWSIRSNARHRRRMRIKEGMSHSDFTSWVSRQEPFCFYCGKECTEDFTVDHYYPLSKGGSHTEDNLVVACFRCNSRKHTRDPEDFIQELKDEV